MLQGYEHVHRYWDRNFNCHGAKILPGEYYVTTEGEMITTVLGSCVSACIRDRVTGVGGMNHFMLPQGSGGTRSDGVSSEARYGNYAMETLINEIIKHGGKRRNLEAKLFGGGQVLAKMTAIGARNIDFVRDYVASENLEVTAEDLGDIYPRRVVFFPATGKAMVKRLVRLKNDTISQRENEYAEELSHQPVSRDVELF
ncbi:chemoreceptor glutamine deamidase CheD [Mangrovimicrobium sediminis]|uniref:Probable chemoreceptor glutamine deamidase CheD n=1 Tax=Mangrovimicrobium sediminis TaxID=2562682 RepID=A0A4Z0LUR9_9GAMM|nr:chemoreceptor glutamine deamidase CheD [Haliea sp. SAOS-164]